MKSTEWGGVGLGGVRWGGAWWVMQGWCGVRSANASKPT